MGFAIAPIFEKPGGALGERRPHQPFHRETYTPVVFTLVEGIGEAGKTTAYVRKAIPEPPFNETQSYEPYVAISTRCAHLGCPVSFVEAANNFICPCHGGVYDFQGKVIGGPPVRPSTTSRRGSATAQVQVGPRYSVTSQLDPVRARDPGEFTGGVWNVIYPPRPDTFPAP